MKLLPAILTDSMKTFVEQLEVIKESPHVDRAHIDIIDGQFANNFTLTPLDMTVVDFGDLTLDFHMMVEEPMDSVFECEAIAEYLPIKRMIGQVERMSYQADFIHEVHRNGWEVGLGLDIYTPLEAIDDASWADLDAVLLMGIEAGHQNKIFNMHVLQKVRDIRKVKPAGDKLKIILDGGVKLSNIARILQNGADEVSVGSALWNSTQPLEVIEEFFEIAKKYAHNTET
jgi:ribulose-phosphate 3-epimerase